jgi:ribosomal protein S18 acetylase RimI-like enzyme
VLIQHVVKARLVSEQHHTISIRDARVTDAAAIARVRVAAWRAGYRGLVPDSYLDRPDFEQVEALHLYAALRDITDQARISVAEVEGQVAGYCAYGACGDDSRQPSYGGVYDLFVHPDAWHCGVGRALLTCATEHLRAQGFAAATLFVYEANARGRAFYQHAGWEADGHREIDERPQFALPVLRYRKVLTDAG